MPSLPDPAKRSLYDLALSRLRTLFPAHFPSIMKRANMARRRAIRITRPKLALALAKAGKEARQAAEARHSKSEAKNCAESAQFRTPSSAGATECKISRRRR
jgi:hypothetical protein